MWMKRSFPLLALTWALVAFGGPQKLSVSVPGKDSELSPEMLAKIGAKTVTLVDGLESTAKKKVKVKYSGFPVAAVLDEAFGGRANWSQAKEIIFECADGYKSRVPAAELAKRKGYLVYERVGDPTFSLTNETQNAKRVNLAPYYLVWDDAAMLKADASGHWPYQVVGVRLEK